jgi:hypothetical protein
MGNCLPLATQSESVVFPGNLEPIIPSVEQ